MAQEEVVSQYDVDEETMDTGLEAEIPRNGTGSQGIEPEPTDIRVYSFFELNGTFLRECRHILVHGLRTPRELSLGRPMKHFLIEIPNFWAWTDKLDR